MNSITITNSVEITKKGLGNDVIQNIKNMLTFKDPNNKQNIYCLYKETNKLIIVPRGAVLGVKRCFKSFNLPVTWISKVTSNKSTELKISDMNIQLRDYQIECIDKMIARVQGIVQMPCGAGKTTTATCAILMTGESAIVLAHTKEICDQWIDTIKRISGKTVRKIASSNRKISWLPLKSGEIAVAMIQTIHSKVRSFQAKEVKAFLKSAGCIVTDEAHHVPADQWRAIVDSIYARYRWGLTATPERSDGLGFMLEIFIGPLLYKVSTKFLIGNNYLQSPTILPVKTGYRPNKGDYGYVRGTADTLNYAKALSTLVKDKKRNNCICDLVKNARKHNRQVLVLVSRKSSATIVSKMLLKKGIISCVMTSDVSADNRELILKSFRRGSIKVIIATQLADEGLDLPNIDCIVSASPAKHHARVLQRVGRALRLGGKQPVIFDLVDEREFRYQFNHRKRAYLKEYGNVVLTEHTTSQAIFYMDEFMK